VLSHFFLTCAVVVVEAASDNGGLERRQWGSRIRQARRSTGEEAVVAGAMLPARDTVVLVVTVRYMMSLRREDPTWHLADDEALDSDRGAFRGTNFFWI
jgi:hypothetical protein